MHNEIILKENNGDAWIDYTFLDQTEQEKYLKILVSKIAWEQRTIKMFGKVMLQPRTCFMVW